MAHHSEPMDVDSDFDNKENSLHHNNVLPFTEKGYEELDVSELNMKLRYSVTPANSPMSKSYTACLDNRTIESGDELNITVNENANLTRSLNTTLTNNDNIVKSVRVLPLQTISTDQFDSRNSSVLRPLDSTISENADVTVTVSGPSDIDENLSLPSSSSSVSHTPEATTPTKDPIKCDGGSPIMRGLKSVLSMFRPSQSPIPPAENEPVISEILSPADVARVDAKAQALLASTPIAAHRKKEPSPSKRNSPKEHKESIVFNEDLEKELQWKDETTILFSDDRMPIHKLMYPQSLDKRAAKKVVKENVTESLNTTVEYMDISYNESMKDTTLTEYLDVNNTIGPVAPESDGEFLDCETSFNKNNDSQIVDKDLPPVSHIQDLDVTKDLENTNTSGSRLKQIILNTTQDILDATLSITPEDLLPESIDNSKEVLSSTYINESLKTNVTMTIQSNETLDSEQSSELTAKLEADYPTGETVKESTQSSENIETNHTLSNETHDLTSPSINTEIKKTFDTSATFECTTNELQTEESMRTIEDQVQNLDCTHTIELDKQIHNLSNYKAEVSSLSEDMKNEQVVDNANITDNVSNVLDLCDKASLLNSELDATLNNTETNANGQLQNQPMLDEQVQITDKLNITKSLDSTATIEPVSDSTSILSQTTGMDNHVEMEVQNLKTEETPKDILAQALTAINTSVNDDTNTDNSKNVEENTVPEPKDILAQALTDIKTSVNDDTNTDNHKNVEENTVPEKYLLSVGKTESDNVLNVLDLCDKASLLHTELDATLNNTETIASGQLQNQPLLDEQVQITDKLNITKSLDSTATIEKVSDSTSILSQTIGMINQVEIEEQNLKTEETPKDILAQALTDINTSVKDDSNTDNHKNVEENTVPEPKDILAQALTDINTSVNNDTNTDNHQNVEEKTIPEKYLLSDGKTESNINSTYIESHSPIESSLPVMSSHEILQAMITPLSSNAIVNLSKEALITELPVDVPLPDDDDIDKEINIPGENIIKEAKETSEFNNKPIECFEIKKMEYFDSGDKAKVTEHIESLSTINLMFEGGDVHINEEIQEVHSEIINENIVPAVVTSLNNENIDLPQRLHPLNETLQSCDLPKNKQIQAVCKELKNFNEITNENAEIIVAPHLNNENIKNAIDVPNNSVLVNEAEAVIALDTLAPSNNTNINIQPQECHQYNIVKQEEISMNINESICEVQPLPDIINQTIPVGNEQKPINVPELTGHITPVPADTPLGIGTDSELHSELQLIEENLNKTNDVLPDSADKHIVSKSLGRSVLDVTMTDLETIDAPENQTTTISQNKVDLDATVNMELDQSVTEPLHVNLDIITDECIQPDDCLEKVNSTTENLDTNKSVIAPHSETILEEEEVLASRNNSPFVSVVAEDIPSSMKTDDNVEIVSIENPLVTENRELVTPPASPPIASKGYNFNFDEMDDPFATKTKIRLSPPLDTPNKPIETKPMSKTTEKVVPKKDLNRRKSQPAAVRNRTAGNKRKLNTTFENNIIDNKLENLTESIEVKSQVELQAPTQVALESDNVTIEESNKIEETVKITEEINPVKNEAPNSKLDLDVEHKNVVSNNPSCSTDPINEANQSSLESSKELNKEIKTPSSSEQSTYYSAGASSSGSMNASRNVFNLPEIDDIHFNPFASKSKMCTSPPPDLENPFETKSKIGNSPDSSIIVPQTPIKSEDKMETEAMEKETIANISSATTSSKATVKTEDEDTIEGPFLEAEDLNDDFDADNIDMMQFNDMPQRQVTEQNADSGEMFIDAEAFEFLLNQNKSNTIVDSGKESLFLKFDPLFAKRMSAITSDGVLAALSKIQKRQSTPTKPTKTPQEEITSPIPGPSNVNVTQDIDANISEEFNDGLNVTISKPMMVVPPAVNPVTPRNKSFTCNTPNRSLTPNTPNRSNRRSLTFTSPAMAVIDRLLSLSGNNSPARDTAVSHATREQHEADLALSQLRELLAEKEINVYNLRSESRELQDRLSTMESQMKNLEADGQKRLKKINELNEKLIEKTKINKSMAAVVEEYERTIASLISETAQDKKRHAEERMKLISERDEQTAHLASMEVSFSDLHSKYEKSKQVIFSCKANEDSYKKSIKEFEENLTKMQNNYELLKQHATSKLNHANTELEKMKKSHETEVLKLHAMIKRKELHITSLEESLTQKTKANEELTAICDELINKVG